MPETQVQPDWQSLSERQERQFVPSWQFPEVSVGQVLSSQVQTLQLFARQFVPSWQLPAESVGQEPSSQEQTLQ